MLFNSYTGIVLLKLQPNIKLKQLYIFIQCNFIVLYNILLQIDLKTNIVLYYKHIICPLQSVDKNKSVGNL